MVLACFKKYILFKLLKFKYNIIFIIYLIYMIQSFFDYFSFKNR